MDQSHLKKVRRLTDEVLQSARSCRAALLGITAYKNSPAGLAFSVRQLQQAASKLLDAAQAIDRMAGDLGAAFDQHEDVTDDTLDSKTAWAVAQAEEKSHATQII